MSYEIEALGISAALIALAGIILAVASYQTHGITSESTFFIVVGIMAATLCTRWIRLNVIPRWL